jgi:hypothetical protein
MNVLLCLFKMLLSMLLTLLLLSLLLTLLLLILLLTLLSQNRQMHLTLSYTHCKGATNVGTLRIGYPRVQASSQDNDSCLLAEGSSEAATCPRGPGSRSRLGAAPGPPRVPAARDSTGSATCPRGLGQLQGHHVPPGLCGLQANKQISSGDPAIMISIGAGTPVSFKALHDKGCSARSQSMQQAAH